MDKWNYLSLFLISISVSEIANKININISINEAGVFQHSDNPFLTSIVSVCYLIAVYCILHIFILAEKQTKTLKVQKTPLNS